MRNALFSVLQYLYLSDPRYALAHYRKPDSRNLKIITYTLNAAVLDAWLFTTSRAKFDLGNSRGSTDAPWVYDDFFSNSADTPDKEMKAGMVAKGQLECFWVCGSGWWCY
ncbi:hypothetical protein K432DRAFT_378632 [Lepidopterella palustris CBS 459.81]|uniref:Uncharacterized protein n=1 Tax=Lepidopterella palustris CBS 459.81 TaxID=1314670 RepID=A0A8E2EI32_9PEZI|nr:hypothetical protein K432DRAFT_378632 [Lepidopterella palustris CBS 459.81]